MLVDERRVEFEVDGEILVGRAVLASPDQKPSLLLLHGAGKSSKDRSSFLTDKLAQEYGISSFSFDFSGHGESSGDLQDSSLNKRLNEARGAIRASNMSQPFGVCGFSMGGHVALELLAYYPINALFLFYPAVYAEKAVQKRFGAGEFSRIIREPESWRHAKVWKSLQEFRGNFVLVTGEHDEVIPPDVTAKLWASAEQAEFRHHIVVEDAPHLLLPCVSESERLLREICSIIKSSGGNIKHQASSAP